ncbi:MAG: hypothetical protein ACTHLA_05290 [Asticcacaulis sp.]|uniref:hypothetical protein n=1 Tax=Asticcacaulis sp. TaxID=1872648 RepID=UPI003F7BE0D0
MNEVKTMTNADADQALENAVPPRGPQQTDPHPNDAVHTDIKPGWDKRPEAYPATRDGLDNIDIPKQRRSPQQKDRTTGEPS